MSRLAAIAALAALPLFSAACGEGGGAASSAAPSTVASGGTAPSIATTAPHSTSAATPPTSSASGVWRGAFEAKKATVTLDPGVKERAWSADEGRAHAGKGEIDLQVLADGVVKGKLRGALGNATVAGTADGDALTMTFAPADGDSSESISGVITLRLKDGKLSGELKASSGDATIVRAATLELVRGEQ